MKLTFQQKLEALSQRFYAGQEWKDVKAGDFYTTARADLELYRVVGVTETEVFTRYTEGTTVISSWPIDEFTNKKFGVKRVHVPDFILKMVPETSDLIETPALILSEDALSLWAAFFLSKSNTLSIARPTARTRNALDELRAYGAIILESDPTQSLHNLYKYSGTGKDLRPLVLESVQNSGHSDVFSWQQSVDLQLQSPE